MAVTRRITSSPVDRVSHDSNVSHYDELTEHAKHYLPCLLGTEETMVTVPDRVGVALEPYDIVKYTDYYRITVTGESASDESLR